jgi:hypothetical protein
MARPRGWRNPIKKPLILNRRNKISSPPRIYAAEHRQNKREGQVSALVEKGGEECRIKGSDGCDMLLVAREFKRA